PSPPFRPVTIEYALMAGQNDAIDDARKLAKLLRGLRVKINLIPMNPIESSALLPSASGEIQAFQQTLRDAGYLCFVRRPRGDDVAAACGQLVQHDASR
ncbi:MAG: 23S rRNA (adenine(2503)-C(2))-methyltransferase RlmN, partial [Deltaproteobacteria bacterium]|nr:23S rRNA (adenine(2503)-C(2))-methyltransferase RlmN [Deltaproteobacteria bacterium]